MTAKYIQQIIFNDTGLKTSVKKGTGSMKGYLIITPMFQSGEYPNFPFEFTQELKNKLSEFDYDNYPLFCSTGQISIYGILDERMQFKRESKPKPIDNNKTQKGWGSKNSQIRLDKATARYAKRMSKGGCARYY